MNQIWLILRKRRVAGQLGGERTLQALFDIMDDKQHPYYEEIRKAA